MNKEASAYPPGFNKTAPNAGFAIEKTAAPAPDYNTIDPYTQYTDASEMDQIFSLLQTEAGRQALGAQMAIPIRTQLDYQGMARRFFEIDVLGQGQIARYDKDINAFAASLTAHGQSVQYIVEGDYVEPVTFEIFAPAAIRLKQIQQRRFNVLDRMQERIRIAVQLEEDDQFLALTETTVSGNTANNPITTSTAGASKDFMNQLSAEIMKWDLPAYAYLMNFKSYAQLRSWRRNDIDPVTQREIWQTGLVGSLWGIDIIVSRKVPNNWVYCYSEPRFTGVFPIRTDLILLPDDTPKEALIGYVGYEEIGMLIVNANSVARGTWSGYIA
jgi:hypothetical protein